MTLEKLYNLKLYEYVETGLRDKPEKLLAMLLLPEKDCYKAMKKSEGEFYKKYRHKIDKKIAKVDKDFNFTKSDIINLIEEKGFLCDDYDNDKIWLVYAEGFGALHWGRMYRKNASPEEIFLECFDDNQLEKQDNIESSENTNIEEAKKLMITNN